MMTSSSTVGREHDRFVDRLMTNEVHVMLLVVKHGDVLARVYGGAEQRILRWQGKASNATISIVRYVLVTFFIFIFPIHSG